MKKKKKLRIGIFLGIFGFSKLIHEGLSGGMVVKNYGVSFGMDSLFLVFLSIFLLLLLTIVFLKKDLYALGLIVAGGWINLIDRMVFGYVRDYWRLTVVYNNLADWLIGIGVVLFLGEILCKKK